MSHWPIERVDEIDSTQDELKRRAANGESLPAILMARHQTKGRGRFDRTWESTESQSLTVSLALPEWQNHQAPWLPGMMTACAAAAAFSIRVQWPNDLTIQKRKTGGILVERITLADGSSQPIVGMGINLTITEFPESIAHRATSLLLGRGVTLNPDEALEKVLARLQPLALIKTWHELLPYWSLLDDTPGKIYTLPTGEEATALGLGSEGQLICSVDGEARSVVAAEALFGTSDSG